MSPRTPREPEPPQEPEEGELAHTIPIEEELDLHPFRPKDVASVVEAYIEEAYQAGLARVRIVHGRGTGTQRDIVRAVLGRNPRVRTLRDAAPGRGGWGATFAELASPLPLDIPTRETEAFLDSVLPPPPARVLEVGAGWGEVAARLIGRGYRVQAIDRDEETVAEAQTRGAPVALADFLEYDAPPFDAVLFTRSLHHIDPLPAAIERAAALVLPGGRLVLEEFAWERMDESSAGWWDAQEQRLVAAGTIAPEEHDDAHHSEGAPLERWRAYHQGHGVHPGSSLLEALGRRFELERVEAAPYLYRNFCFRAHPTAAAFEAMREVLGEERTRNASGTLVAIGLRVVARPRG